ncbi:MAG: chemotaxis protein CheW [Spirochaetaceae bacterium]|nr:chemotaxis protein CheW [Spirochaetaceae bacterium]
MNEQTENTNVYFTFFLGDGAFAINVQSVKEVLSWEPITPVPRTVSYMKGVMNIRGSVISVIDFRTLFDIEPTADEKATSIIVTEVSVDDEQQPLTFGIIADRVEGVGPLDTSIRSDISSSRPVSSMNNKFIKQLGEKDGQFVLILDMEEILKHVEENLAKNA